MTHLAQTWASPGPDLQIVDEASLWGLISKASRPRAGIYVTQSWVESRVESQVESRKLTWFGTGPYKRKKPSTISYPCQFNYRKDIWNHIDNPIFEGVKMKKFKKYVLNSSKNIWHIKAQADE